MINYSLKSLKENKSRTFFYFITFVLTTLLIFSIFNISMSSSFSIGANDSTMITLLAILVSSICMSVVFFANDFFVKDKSKEIAVDLICGGRYIQIVIFLLIQTGLVFITALPIGILIGIVCIPLENAILTSFYTNINAITISFQSMGVTAALLFVEILWCTILNLGYSYRCSIRSLIYGEEKHHGSVDLPFSFKVALNKAMYIIFFFVPIVTNFMGSSDSAGTIVFGLIGLFGVHGIIRKIIVPTIEKNGRYKYTSDSNKLVYMGLFKTDLKNVEFIILLLNAACIMFISILSVSSSNPVQAMISLFAYVCSIVLLALAITFKFGSEIPKRNKIFHSLITIGFLPKEINKVILKEITYLYGFIIFICLAYITPMLISMCINQLIVVNFAMILIVFFIVCLLLGAIINYLYYIKKKTF